MSEIEEIRRKYEAGQFDEIRADLRRFIHAHRQNILSMLDQTSTPITEDTAVKLYILKHRSINPRREIQEQLEEIRREKWIRGIHMGCDPNAEEVAADWARKYSAGWRSHRVMSIVYVFEREKDQFVPLLRA